MTTICSPAGLAEASSMARRTWRPNRSGVDPVATMPRRPRRGVLSQFG